MNEQIQILFKLIRKQKHTSNLMSNPPQVRYSYTINEEDIEKFAELIVRECAEIGDGYDNETKYNQGLIDIDIQTAGDEIRKHFGVER